MKKFEILRYLKRFSMLIFLLTMAGAAMIYLYAQGKQQYTASVVLKYTNDGIKDGYAPDGSDLDVNEIYSSTVIAQAMDSLGASGRHKGASLLAGTERCHPRTDSFRGFGFQFRGAVDTHGRVCRLHEPPVRHGGADYLYGEP